MIERQGSKRRFNIAFTRDDLLVRFKNLSHQFSGSTSGFTMLIRRFESAQSGFMLPSIIAISGALLIISLAVAQLVISNQQAVTRGMYEQIALTAAKSGIDYAKEQFVATGSYDGTSEQAIIANGQYRATFEVTVLETSSDGLEKKVESIGRIYIPEESTLNLLLSSVKSELIRTTATAITPDEFSPLAWYDGSDNSTVHETGSTTANWTDLNGNSDDYLNERYSNGSQTNGSWNSNWMSFGYNSVLSSDTYAGTIFHLSGIPDGATINNAYIQFKSHGTTFALSWVQIQALAMSALEPDGSFNAPTASNQLRNQPTVGPTVNWGVLVWPIGGQSGPSQRTPNLRDLVQATLEQPGFDPAVHHIGFRLDRILGIGNHRVSKGEASLVVNYSVEETSTAEDGDAVSTWDDKSGNGRHLEASGSNQPIYQTAEQNGLSMVQFQNGDFMQSQVFDLLNQADAGTAFVVTRANAASGTGATIFELSGSIPAEANCVGGSPCETRRYRMSRDGSSADLNFVIERSGAGGTAGQGATSPTIFNSSTAMLAGGVAFTPDSCNPDLPNAAIDIAHNSSYVSNCPATANPKSFKDGLTMTVGSGTSGAIFDGYIGEIVMYDKQLSCQQTQSVQKYLREKWFADSSDTNIISCPAPPVPSF